MGRKYKFDHRPAPRDVESLMRDIYVAGQKGNEALLKHYLGVMKDMLYTKYVPEPIAVVDRRMMNQLRWTDPGAESFQTMPDGTELFMRPFVVVEEQAVNLLAAAAVEIRSLAEAVQNLDEGQDEPECQDEVEEAQELANRIEKYLTKKGQA